MDDVIILHPDKISTLAPREGSDYLQRMGEAFELYFNPRSPRGERR